MPNSTVPAAHEGLPNLPDPIHALIEEHRTAQALMDQMSWELDEKDPRFLAALDQELALWRSLVKIRPTTLAGAAALAAYTENYPDVGLVYGDDLQQAMSTVAVALRDLLPA
jgi:hypothetical protein